jgi:hypothetical protein
MPLAGNVSPFPVEKKSSHETANSNNTHGNRDSNPSFGTTAKSPVISPI